MRYFAVFVLLPYCGMAQSQSAVQGTAIRLKRTIEINHIAPRPVDDRFSSDLFRQFFEAADPDHVFFTQADMASFEKFRTTLDDELQQKGWSFLNTVYPVLKKRVLQADSTVLGSLQKPFDFSAAEQVPANFRESRAADEAGLRKRWQLLLKRAVWQGLGRYVKPGAPADAIKNAFAREPELRRRIAGRYQRNLQYLLAGDASALRSSMEQDFLSAIARCFDPHTDFFDPGSKAEFRDALDTEGMYFGFTLADNEKDEVVIRQLMPGSPAWKSGALNPNDVFLQLQWEGQDPVDVSGATAREVNEMIDEVKGRLSITVRKPNAALVTVTLQRERVENDDDIVKSFILSGQKKIGYIYLPSFYTSWEQSSGSSCAADVAKEIIKLKKDGIEGLILDVRFNGGGSLQEAIELAGIFIDEGPMGQFRNPAGKLVSLRDMNRGTVWDGALLLMVNGQSASASEMIAAALQDYNRAIIAGSNTHGKATAQQFIPLDTFSKASELTVYRGDAHLKITNGKLYRVTGKTAQGTGVQPDILLPDLYAAFSKYEYQLPFFIAGDTAKRNGFYRPLPPLDLVALRSASTQRVAAHAKFRQLKTWADKNAALQTAATWLSMDGLAKQALASGEQQQMQQIMKHPTPVFKAVQHSFDKKVSEFSKETDQRWLERLTTDPYVEECFFIISDFINQSTPKKLL